MGLYGNEKFGKQTRVIQNCDSPSFLTHFNSLFPLTGKNTSWLCACPPPDQLSNVILTLLVQRLQLQRWTTTPAQTAGNGGLVTAATNAPLTGGSSTAPSLFSNNCSWDLSPGLELYSLGLVGRLVVRPSKKPSVTWHRPHACWLDLPIPDEQPDATTYTSSHLPI